MFERFTEKAIKVVMISQEESRRLGHNFVGTEQMLLGLIGEGTGIAARALKQEGLTLKDLRIEVERIIGRGSGFVAVEIPFTPRAKRVLEESIETARDFGHGYVATEHLLLALLDQQDGVAWQIFKDLEIDRNAIRTEVLLYLGIESESPFTPSSLPTPAGNKFPNNNRDYSLEDYTTNLTTQAREGMLDPVVGREKEIQRVIQILVRRKKNNPVLIGEPGVGKTAVAEGLALRIVGRDVPEILSKKEIISLDIGLLLAGTKYRGEFEERIKRIMDEVQSNRDLVLVIDEVHTVIGAGAAEGAVDAANILKPALARGELQCLGATTIEEYRKNIEKDPALERRFQPVTVPEPSIEDTILILKGLRETYEFHHKVDISDEAITAAAKLGAQFIADRFLPDKAIDLIDEACAKARLDMASFPENIRDLEEEVQNIINLKASALAKEDFNAANDLNIAEQTARAQLKLAVTAARLKQPQKYTSAIGYNEIAEIVSEWTGIPVTKVSKDETDKLVRMEELLHQRVIGQEAAVSAVSSAIRRARVGLKNPNRPIASFIFSGPTGVGKTELTKALASYFFGSEDSMVRLDMSEYMERHHVAKLIGSPPGYVGFSEGGYLTEAVRRKPYTVLLFDEVEKAHPDVFNLLLQILEDGRLTDSHGRVINFKNTLIILTSNIGAKSIEKSDVNLGFGASDEEVREAHNRTVDLVHDELKQFFRPEFLNRIDEIIVFQPLTRKDIRQIADLMLKEIVNRVNEQGLDLEITSAARDKLAMDGFNPAYGARPLRRTIMSSLEDKLASLMLNITPNDGTSFLVDVVADEIKVTLKSVAQSSSEVSNKQNSKKRRVTALREKNRPAASIS